MKRSGSLERLLNLLDDLKKEHGIDEIEKDVREFNREFYLKSRDSNTTFLGNLSKEYAYLYFRLKEKYEDKDEI